MESSFSASMSEFDPGADIVVYALNIVALCKVFAYTFGFLDRPLVEYSCWRDQKYVMSLRNQHSFAGSVLSSDLTSELVFSWI